MGCSSSKQSGGKQEERSSWYAPVSRCLSAPIHYAAQSKENSCHVVSLTSCSYVILESPGCSAHMGNFTKVANEFDKNGLVFGDEDYRAIMLSDAKGVCNSMNFKLGKELPENHRHIETINAWDQMEGLEDQCSETPFSQKGPLIQYQTPGKYLLSDSMQELDSCVAQIASPICNKISLQDGARLLPQVGCASVEGFIKASEMNNTSRVHATMSSLYAEEMDEDTHKDSSWANSTKATSGQAVDAINTSRVVYPNEGSTATNLPSFFGRTWTSSETSFVAGSSLLDTGVVIQKGHAVNTKTFGNPTFKRYSKDIKPLHLESFEHKCPYKGELKVVLYFTRLRGIRKTFEDCCDVRAILQGYGVCVDERDVWMHGKFREELAELFDGNRLQLLRLFIKGKYIGGFDEVKQLHEYGALMQLLDDLPTFGLLKKVCDGCLDVRFVPCLACNGSCKLLTEMDKVVRCPKCNENGLIMCPICSC